MNLPPRAIELIRTLDLQPHPEGGFYREIFRSATHVTARQRTVERNAVTAIYFLLAHGTFSRWHRVSSDETWHWYEGEPLELWVCPPDCSDVQLIDLGPVSEQQRPVYTVPAGWWQAARPMGAYALAGCTVAPGFEFEDFSFLSDDRDAAAGLRALGAQYAALL